MNLLQVTEKQALASELACKKFIRGTNCSTAGLKEICSPLEKVKTCFQEYCIFKFIGIDQLINIYETK